MKCMFFYDSATFNSMISNGIRDQKQKLDRIRKKSSLIVLAPGGSPNFISLVGISLEN